VIDVTPPSAVSGRPAEPALAKEAGNTTGCNEADLTRFQIPGEVLDTVQDRFVNDGAGFYRATYIQFAASQAGAILWVPTM